MIKHSIKALMIAIITLAATSSCQAPPIPISANATEATPQPVTTPAEQQPDVTKMLAKIDTPVAQADPSEAQKEEQEAKAKRDYSAILKDPKLLKFTPNETLFRNVYYYIKKSFVEDISSDELFNGVKDELKDLLEQAKIPTSGLNLLNPDQKVLPQLVSMYGNKIDSGIITFAAIMGMLDALDDRYSILMLPDDYSKLQEQMQATEFGGIGIYIELDKDSDNQLTVFEPIEGAPAYAAGLQSGDRVTKIDNESTKGIDIEAAQTKIRGPVGSKVTLEVKRKGHQAPLVFKITRGNIHVVSVSEKLIDGKIGYLRLRQFGAKTSEELTAALRKLKDQGATAFILDLRNNGGGYIDASVDIVGQFLSKSDGLVVYTIDRSNRRREYRATSPGHPVPLVVLINEYSASASEITAGALRDHGLAKLVGHKSFGKGSVQQLYPFADGSALKLTIAKFYTPLGHVINKHGLEPDIKIEMEPRFVGREGKDTQLKKAVEIIESQIKLKAS